MRSRSLAVSSLVSVSSFFSMFLLVGVSIMCSVVVVVVVVVVVFTIVVLVVFTPVMSSTIVDVSHVSFFVRVNHFFL